MPLQISKGHVYNPGDVVDAADLNALVDSATLLKGAIGEQGAVAIATNDYLLFTDTSNSGALQKGLVSSLPAGGTVSSVGMTVAPTSVLAVTGTPVTTTGTLALSLNSQLGNKVLAAPSDGSLGSPAFRVLVPADTESLRTIPGTYIIDCSLGSAFSLALTANTTLSLRNGIAGQTIKVWLRQDSPIRTLAWTAPGGTIVWRGGTVPVIAATPNWVDIYTFFCTGTDYFGKADEDFH